MIDFEVKMLTTAEVAKLFHTTPPKIIAAIKNHTLPIGFFADGDTNRAYIVEKRLKAYVEAQDLTAKIFTG